MSGATIEDEISSLLVEIKRLGRVNSDGKFAVKFGVLIRDDRCADLFEAITQILRAAKIIHFEGEILLQGAHDSSDVTII